MEVNQFIKANDDIQDEMKEKLTRGNIFPVYDGPIDPESYYNSPIKITWLLKEAYTDKKEDNTYGDFYYGNDLWGDEKGMTDFVLHHKSKKTWQPITYISYSILHGFPKYDYMDDLDKNPEMIQILNQIAVLNTKKLPNISSTISNYSEIAASFIDPETNNILRRQLTLLNPHIVIGANVFVGSPFLWANVS